MSPSPSSPAAAVPPSPTKPASLKDDGDDNKNNNKLAPVVSISEASILLDEACYNDKRRYYGLVIIVLLNIVQIWAWLSYTLVQTYSQEWFGVGPQAINWFSTIYGLAFLPFPASGWFINKYGIRKSVMIGSIATAVGSWVRYAGTAKASFAGAMIGQTILGLSQLLVLPVASAYSGQWFHPNYRTLPTTLGTISPTLGAVVGSFSTPYLAPSASAMPRSILIVSIISTVVSFGGLFLPGRPTSAPQARPSAEPHAFPDAPTPMHHILAMLKSPEFYMVSLPFIVGLAIFNCFTSLLLLYLIPYGFPVEDTGLMTGLQTGVGVVVALATAPLVDKWHLHIPLVKIANVLIALLYIGFVFVPSSRSRGAAFVVVTFLGSIGTINMAVCLEILAEILYPVPPEFTSTTCWCMGNVLGAVWLFGFAAGINENGNPPGEMSRSLYAQAAMAVVFLALPINLLGLFGRKDKIRFRRREIESQCQLGES
ncbi:hypothetical protein FNYG_15519 [Fusarium nygamai]|uniref:Major facilitator superfamily (MFS) profile domain-containing protein n=1 Tax=Gibberella nygamai TaxID=42673 RepID=A0A2K0UCA0_GIBNY|nr:hypothetical protein FNYG_15519 [Fusarium nygamai]